MKKFTLSTTLTLALLFCAFASSPDLSPSEGLFPSDNSVYQLSLPFSQDSPVSLKQTNTVLSSCPPHTVASFFISLPAEALAKGFSYGILCLFY